MVTRYSRYCSYRVLKLFPECVAIVLKNVSKTDKDQDFELRDSFLNFNLSLQQFYINSMMLI